MGGLIQVVFLQKKLMALNFNLVVFSTNGISDNLQICLTVFSPLRQINAMSDKRKPINQKCVQTFFNLLNNLFVVNY